MAEIPYSSFLASKPFRFIVGPHREEFTLHSALVASQSRALNVVVNGPMKEATDGFTTWEDVDGQTFTRFGQYVYTGDYEGESPLEPEPMPEEPRLEELVAVADEEQEAGEEPKAEEEPQYTVDFWDSAMTSKKKSKKKRAENTDLMPSLTKREILLYEFENNRLYDCGIAGIHFSPRNRNCLLEYKEVFLSHARLHMVAEYYGVEKLAQLTLHKLHRTLCNFVLHNERIGDVVGLLRYCFEEDERVELRELVVMYSVCHFEKLWESADFQQLLKAHTELSVAILGSMLARLD
ncbi:hypothetical protein QQS21_003747 [Conoideocrella luteorostrata]|uniref:BTB domain-containing protein n=1 Tax=Conoideocrella luteorostrata TaxID=1105319 RepID=A0AAJ0G0B1_9HYPO|nr:hypothetical protein QQS21_003747 [Conoideocrella luteorostrata]